MIRVGRVIEAQGDRLSVCFSRPEACESCGMCGTGRDNTTVTLKGQAQVGDQVEVDMPEAQVLKVSLVSYMLPLLGLLLGLYVGTQVFNNREMFVMLAGFIGLALALIALKLVDKKAAKTPKWQPRLLRVLTAEEIAALTGNEN